MQFESGPAKNETTFATSSGSDRRFIAIIINKGKTFQGYMTPLKNLKNWSAIQENTLWWLSRRQYRGGGVFKNSPSILSDYSLFRALYVRYKGVLQQHFSTFLHHTPLYTFIFQYFLTFMVSIPIFSNNIVVFLYQHFPTIRAFYIKFFHVFVLCLNYTIETLRFKDNINLL